MSTAAIIRTAPCEVLQTSAHARILLNFPSLHMLSLADFRCCEGKLMWALSAASAVTGRRYSGNASVSERYLSSITDRRYGSLMVSTSLLSPTITEFSKSMESLSAAFRIIPGHGFLAYDFLRYFTITAFSW